MRKSPRTCGRRTRAIRPTCQDEGCAADLSPDGVLNFDDVVAFLAAFASMDPEADFAPPEGVFDFSDVTGFLAAFGAGCP